MKISFVIGADVSTCRLKRRRGRTQSLCRRTSLDTRRDDLHSAAIEDVHPRAPSGERVAGARRHAKLAICACSFVFGDLGAETCEQGALFLQTIVKWRRATIGARIFHCRTHSRREQKWPYLAANASRCETKTVAACRKTVTGIPQKKIAIVLRDGSKRSCVHNLAAIAARSTTVGRLLTKIILYSSTKVDCAVK
jgi:hypothetical protein